MAAARWVLAKGIKREARNARREVVVWWLEIRCWVFVTNRAVKEVLQPRDLS